MQQLRPYMSRDKLINLNPEEVKFAKEQLHRLLKEMSRVTADMDKRKRLQHSLDLMQRKQEESMAIKMSQLNQKISTSEIKRNKIMQDKLAHLRAAEQKFQDKVDDRARRQAKEENQAAKRSKTYSDDLISYLKRKQVQRANIQQQIQRQYQQRVKSKSDFESGQLETIESFRQYSSQAVNTRCNTIIPNSLQESIRCHQQRAKRRAQDIWGKQFQKVLKKMDITNKKSVHPKRVVERLHPVERRYKLQDQVEVASGEQRYVPRVSPTRKSIDYLQLKRQRQEEQFNQRGDMLDRMRQKSRRGDILRQLKGKVKSQSISLLCQLK